MAVRPQVVAFDVNETITSMVPVQERLAAVGLPPTSLKLWFAHTLRDGFALTLAGEYRPFLEVAASALQPLLHQHHIEPTPEVLDKVIGGFAYVEPHSDVRPALEALHHEGVRIITLTNGGAKDTAHMLERAGLQGLVERIISVAEVERWKPHPAPYQHALSVTGVAPAQMALVAVHGWDILGASRVGLTTGWASRQEGLFPPAMGQPDASGPTLVEVIEELQHFPAG